MNNRNNSDAYIIKEKKILTLKDKLVRSLLLLIAILILVLTTLYFTNRLHLNFLTTTQTPTPQLGYYGLEPDFDSAKKPTGNIFYSILSPNLQSASEISTSYKYNFVNNKSEKISDEAISEINPLVGSTTSLVLTQTPQSGSNSWQPQFYSSQTKKLLLINNTTPDEEDSSLKRRLRVSPDGSSYLYTTVQSPETLKDPLSSWIIKIATIASGTIGQIPEAYTGEWMNGGNKLLYIKTDGIYQYDVNTKISQLVFSVYPEGNQGYDDTDEIAISPDFKTVILTRPTLNLILIMNFESESGQYLIDKGWISKEANSYNSPRFSPDGLHYAVVTKKISDIQGEGASTTFKVSSSIDIRQTNSVKIEKSIELPTSVGYKAVYISSWSVE